MVDRVDEPNFAFGTFSDLQKSVFNFSHELHEAYGQAQQYAKVNSGLIGQGKVHLDEFSPAYLKTHKMQPNQEIDHQTANGLLHLHFDGNGLPAAAELDGKNGISEHVTTDTSGHILSDDYYNGQVRTTHLAYDADHHLLEASIDGRQYAGKKYLGPYHVDFKFDAHQHLTFARSEYPNGIEEIHNEPDAKTIVTSNPREGTDVDTYNYSLKTGKLESLEVKTNDGQELLFKPGPGDRIDVQPLTKI
jgi:hypothetical protein